MNMKRCQKGHDFQDAQYERMVASVAAVREVNTKRGQMGYFLQAASNVFGVCGLARRWGWDASVRFGVSSKGGGRWQKGHSHQTAMDGLASVNVSRGWLRCRMGWRRISLRAARRLQSAWAHMMWEIGGGGIGHDDMSMRKFGLAGVGVDDNSQHGGMHDVDVGKKDMHSDSTHTVAGLGTGGNGTGSFRDDSHISNDSIRGRSFRGEDDAVPEGSQVQALHASPATSCQVEAKAAAASADTMSSGSFARAASIEHENHEMHHDAHQSSHTSDTDSELDGHANHDISADIARMSAHIDEYWQSPEARAALARMVKDVLGSMPMPPRPTV